MRYDTSGMLSAGTTAKTAAVRRANNQVKASNNKRMPREDVPPAIVRTSSVSATASSVSILKYSMPINYVGKKVTFQMSVKDYLFLVVKFLPYGDDDANLDYSLDVTTVCGFLHLHCGVSEDDTHNWWKDQKKNLRKMLMDFRNNCIKEIQKHFISKLAVHFCPTLY